MKKLFNQGLVTYYLFNPASKTQLKHFDFNRQLNRAAVRKLKRSLESKGIIYSDPIVVRTKSQSMGNKKYEFYILDGQHRVQAAIETNQQIVIKCIDMDNEVEIGQLIGMLNSSQLSWIMPQFVHLWKSLQITTIDYTKLDVLTKEYDLGYNAAADLLMYGHVSNRKSAHIKEGNFTVNHEEMGFKTAKLANEFVDLVAKDDDELFKVVNKSGFKTAFIDYHIKHNYNIQELATCVANHMVDIKAMPKYSNQWYEFIYNACPPQGK
jgi:hypothetical protein